jgi:hypothetical protein
VLMVFWAGNAGLSTTLWNHNAEIQWALWELSVDCDENRELQRVYHGVVEKWEWTMTYKLVLTW